MGRIPGGTSGEFPAIIWGITEIISEAIFDDTSEVIARRTPLQYALCTNWFFKDRSGRISEQTAGE